jgi:hypothetical protein
MRAPAAFRARHDVLSAVQLWRRCDPRAVARGRTCFVRATAWTSSIASTRTARCTWVGPATTSAREVPGLTVHGLSSSGGALSPFLSQQTGLPLLKGRRVREILDRSDPDVIHFHNVSLFGTGHPEASGEGRTGAQDLHSRTNIGWCARRTCCGSTNRRVCDARDCIRCTLRAGRPPQVWRYTRMIERCAAEVRRLPGAEPLRSGDARAARLHARRSSISRCSSSGPARSTVDLPRPHPQAVLPLRRQAGGRQESTLADRGVARRVPSAICSSPAPARSSRTLRSHRGATNRGSRFLATSARRRWAGLYVHCIRVCRALGVVEIFRWW